MDAQEKLRPSLVPDGFLLSPGALALSAASAAVGILEVETEPSPLLLAKADMEAFKAAATVLYVYCSGEGAIRSWYAQFDDHPYSVSGVLKLLEDPRAQIVAIDGARERMEGLFEFAGPNGHLLRWEADTIMSARNAMTKLEARRWNLDLRNSLSTGTLPDGSSLASADAAPRRSADVLAFSLRSPRECHAPSTGGQIVPFPAWRSRFARTQK